MHGQRDAAPARGTVSATAPVPRVVVNIVAVAGQPLSDCRPSVTSSMASYVFSRSASSCCNGVRDTRGGRDGGEDTFQACPDTA